MNLFDMIFSPVLANTGAVTTTNNLISGLLNFAAYVIAGIVVFGALKGLKSDYQKYNKGDGGSIIPMLTKVGVALLVIGMVWALASGYITLGQKSKDLIERGTNVVIPAVQEVVP